MQSRRPPPQVNSLPVSAAEHVQNAPSGLVKQAVQVGGRSGREGFVLLNVAARSKSRHRRKRFKRILGGLSGRESGKKCSMTDLRFLKRRITGAGCAAHLVATADKREVEGSGFTFCRLRDSRDGGQIWGRGPASCFSPPSDTAATPATSLPRGSCQTGGRTRPASMHLADRRLGRCTASTRHNQ